MQSILYRTHRYRPERPEGMMAHTIEMEQSAQAEFGQIEVAQIEVAQIEDPRDHSTETQERLRHLLVSGAPARPDPKRTDVFEIEDHERIFYVHVAKSSGKVTLLAVWNRDTELNTGVQPATLD